MIEQCLWFIGNAIGDSEDLRDLMIENTCLIETMSQLVKIVRVPRTLLKTMCWVNSNINRPKRLSKEIILMSLDVVNAGLFTDDVDIESDCLWAMSYMSDTTDDDLIDKIASP